MADAYAVMGHPIAHSRSPFIHARFAAATGEDVSYEAIDVAPDGFALAVDAFRARGGRGLNVTLPFKEQAFALADARTRRAEEAGAVNTLWFDGASVHGDNTDGVGLLRDLERNNAVTVAGRRVLVLGAGGAARGVLGPLLSAGPRALVVANRTRARAEALCADFAGRGDIAAAGLSELDSLGAFDVLVNATSAALHGGMPELPRGVLAARACCYDMLYAEEPTPFLRWAAANGAGAAIDGTGMLVEQAAESFSVWRGVHPDTAPVIDALRDLLGCPEKLAATDR